MADQKDIFPFLQERGVGDEAIQQMQSQKIDSSTVLLMDDETLARYLPALGDRMALKSYCTKQAGSNSHDGKYTNHVRKNVLLEKLRKKMKLKQSSAVSSDSSDDENHSQHKVGKSMVGNKYAAKSNRKIEFGWIHNGRQVRVRGGGGTRKISVPKNMDCEGLLKIGKDLFFPDGQSKKGNEKEFIFKIWDFKENVLPLGVTVGDVYEKVKMGIVRFYLASLDQNRVETTVQVVDNVLEERSSTVDCNVPFDAAESAQVHLPEKVSMHPVSETCTSNSSRNVRSDSLKEMPANHCFLTDSAATECDIGLCSSGNIITSAFVSVIFSSDSEVEFYPFNVESEVCDDTVPWVTPGIPNEYQPVPTSLKPMLETNNPIVCSTPEHRPPNSPVRQEQLITFITSSTPAPSSALQQMHPLPPNSTPAPSSPPLQLSDVYYVTLHRVIIVQDMIAAFKDSSILNASLKISFADEAGADASGVSRDAYAAFWATFMQNRAEGELERVPALCPEYGKEEWESLGRILIKGYIDHSYFPIQLSLAFVVAVVHGESKITPEILIDSFLSYIASFEKDVITAAMNGSIGEDDHDELLEILSRMGCHTVPSLDDMKGTILQVAHKQLIQEPKYALDIMSNIIRSTLQMFLPDVSAVVALYEAKKVTVKGVLKLIEAKVQNAAQNKTLNFLKQFIRSLHDERLQKFLRFVTGADIMCVEKIEVQFTTLRGLERRPIAHTCGPLLEVPCTYNSYPEFRSEFQNILDGDCHRMDIM